MKLFRFFVIFIIFLYATSSNAKDPGKLISELVAEASKTLSSDDPVESKIIKLNDIAERNVDIKGLSMYTLGKYRKTLNEDQKLKYQKLFRSYFLKSFSSRLVDYSDPKIEVVTQKKLNDNYTIVQTKLQATKNNLEINIDWRVYTKNKERPLIRDLLVEGLSLARTQKEEFNSILQNNDGSFDALFKTLEEFIIK